jgi:hypothetical protein
MDLKGRKTDRGENCMMNFTACILPSSNIFRVIKLRMMMCAGHVARMGEGGGV